MWTFDRVYQCATVQMRLTSHRLPDGLILEVVEDLKDVGWFSRRFERTECLRNKAQITFT